MMTDRPKPDRPEERWAKRITRPDLYQLASRGNILIRGDRVYSYGMHFTIAQVNRDANGKPVCVLFNGDRYSPSTSQHQESVRSAVRRFAPDIPFVVIPFTALRAADVDPDSIRPLDVKAEGWTFTEQTADTMPERAQQVPRDDAGWRDVSGFSILHEAYQKEQGTWNAETETWDTSDAEVPWPIYMERAPMVPAVMTERGWQEVRRTDDGRYTWHTARHWLGESVVSARVRGRKRRAKFISSFDRNEPSRLYFFCELPPTKAVTLEDAIESLKPDTVRMAEQMGRECERQGDIFAIPMPGLTGGALKAQGGQMVKRSHVRRGELAKAKADRLMERMAQAEDVRFRTPDYLQHRENMRRASFGRAPWGSPRVNPIGIRGGWQQTPASREATARANATGEYRRAKWESLLLARVTAAYDASADASGIALLGTAHTATAVVTMPDGSQYAQGTMYHDPALMGESRDRDHVRRKMGDGKTWHLIQKNTVPVSKTADRRSSALV